MWRFLFFICFIRYYGTRKTILYTVYRISLFRIKKRKTVLVLFSSFREIGERKTNRQYTQEPVAHHECWRVELLIVIMVYLFFQMASINIMFIGFSGRNWHMLQWWSRFSRCKIQWKNAWIVCCMYAKTSCHFFTYKTVYIAHNLRES